MYARPIRIWRGVIPAVRSCSYPLTAGSGKPINGSGTAERTVDVDTVKARKAKADSDHIET